MAPIPLAIIRWVIKHVWPIRKVAEQIRRIRTLEREVDGYKRQLNLIGDQVHVFNSYQDALSELTSSSGYDNQMLSDYIVRKTGVYVSQIESRSRHITNDIVHSMLAATVVAQTQKRLRVLDFGGGGATPSAILNFLTSSNFDYQWSTVELPTLVTAADALVMPKTTWHESIEDAVRKLGVVDLVHTAGTLQYVEKPQELLEKLLSIGASHAFFGRTAFNAGSEYVIGIQKSNVRDHGIQISLEDQSDGFVEYPFTYMPKAEFDRVVDAAGYELIAGFESDSGMRPITNSALLGAHFYIAIGG